MLASLIRMPFCAAYSRNSNFPFSEKKKDYQEGNDKKLISSIHFATHSADVQSKLILQFNRIVMVNMVYGQEFLREGDCVT